MHNNLDYILKLANLATPLPWEVKTLPTNRDFHYAASDCIRSGMVFHASAEDTAYITAACNAVPELITENRTLRERVRELEYQRDYLAKLLGDLCTTQKDGECPLFYACPASGFGWSCGNAIKESWIYAAEQAAKEAGE